MTQYTETELRAKAEEIFIKRLGTNLWNDVVQKGRSEYFIISMLEMYRLASPSLTSKTENEDLTLKEIVKIIFNSPATNGKAEESIENGVALLNQWYHNRFDASLTPIQKHQLKLEQEIKELTAQLQQAKTEPGKWVKVNSEADFPSQGGMYHVRIGPLKDKTCWTRSKIIERFNEGGCEIEYLPEESLPTPKDAPSASPSPTDPEAGREQTTEDKDRNEWKEKFRGMWLTEDEPDDMAQWVINNPPPSNVANLLKEIEELDDISDAQQSKIILLEAELSALKSTPAHGYSKEQMEEYARQQRENCAQNASLQINAGRPPIVNRAAILNAPAPSLPTPAQPTPEKVSDAVDFAEWIEKNNYWCDEYEDDGITKLAELGWSNDSVNPQFFTTYELYNRYKAALASINTKKEK